MKRALLLVSLIWLPGRVLLAAQDIPLMRIARLGLHEAWVLVEHIPDMLEDRQRGLCPVADLTGLSAEAAYFHLRNACSEGSGLIGHYKVNLMTGQVFGGGLWDKLVETPLLEKLRQQLRIVQESRLLDERDGRCLMQRLPVLRDPELGHLCPKLGDRSWIGVNADYIQFVVSYGCGARSDWWEQYYVDRLTGLVVHVDSGRTVESPELAELRTWMLAARQLPELTPAEAALLAESSPVALKAKAEGLCPKAHYDSPLSGATEMWFHLWPACPEGEAAGFRAEVVVNRFTGAVRDPRSLEPWSTGELKALAEQLLDRARERVERAKRNVARACGW